VRPIEAQHPSQLSFRRPLGRGATQPAVEKTVPPVLGIPVPPAPKRPLANPQGLGRPHLAQLPPLMPIQRLKTHQTDLLQHLWWHAPLRPQRSTLWATAPFGGKQCRHGRQGYQATVAESYVG
jgi:hypothetical protein